MTIHNKTFRKTTLAVAAMLMCGAAPLEEAMAASSCTWLPSTGDWGTAGNWSCNVVPSAPPQDSATIAATKVVTISSDQSIYTLLNGGTINIDSSTFTLSSGGSTTNSGTLNVGSAVTATLQASNSIDNTGGTIHIATGSVLNQFGSTITGGTISTSGTGALVAQSNGNNLLSGVTLNGTLDAASIANGRERIDSGITLGGASINIANGGIVSLDGTTVPNNSISGSGTFNLNDANARLSIEGAGSTTLGANVVVRGQGDVGTALFAAGNNLLTNNGRISADVNTGTLNIAQAGNSGSLTNHGTLDARNGGTLQLTTSVSNASGQISALNGSKVVQNGFTVSGGAIGTVGTGAFQATSNGNNILDNVTVTGLLDLTSTTNSRERIVNGLVLNGTANLANGGILSLDSTATSGGAQTISGNATINLNDANAHLSVEGSGSTTLDSNVTVRGQGNIGSAIFSAGNNTLTSKGLISADVAGGTLEITAPGNSGSFVNSGTLQAINGGRLLLSTNITADAGSKIVSGAGSSVVQSGITINGVFSSSGGGLFTASSNGNNILDAVTFTGALDASSIVNARERIGNNLTINGSIDIGNGGVVSLDSTLGAANAISGTASINLKDAGAWLAVEGAGTTTLGSNVTVHGQGLLGQALFSAGNNVLTNDGLVSADVKGGTLNIVTPANAGSFVNNGKLQATGGATLELSTSINANAGSQIVAQADSTVLQNGVTLNGVINTIGTGVVTATSNSNNYLNNATFTGTVDMASAVNSRERIVGNLTLNGNVNISNGGIASLDSTQVAANVISGTGTFNLNDSSAYLSIEGTGSTTLGANITVRGQGLLGRASYSAGNNVLTNNGLISADVNGGTLEIDVPANSGSLTNHSNIEARNGGTLLLSTSVANAGGQISAQAGSIVTQNGVTISGGLLNTTGSGLVQATSNSNNYLDNVTLNGTLDLAAFVNSRERIINGAVLNGSINISNGGILSLDSAETTGTNQTLGGTATINLNDAHAQLSVEGAGTTTLGSGITIRGQGNVGTALFTAGNNLLVNNGTIVADGGTLTVAPPANSGSLAGTGTLKAAGGALNLSMSTGSTQGKLIVASTAGSAVNLNTQNLTITNDYSNAQSGSGNAFDRRADITGTGMILAGGDAAQKIIGTGVTGGATSNATLTLGNVRVGSTTYDYQIANSGTTGPSLRGAIQTNVNGANLTDSRLSGSGVTASNYNTGAPGSNTGNLAVVFTANSAGALSPLNGQVLNLTSNFDNIADQKLNIVLASGASAYNAAIGSAVSPVQIANQRIGGSNTANVAVSNTAAAGKFSEDLNAAVTGSAGAATGSGAINGRVAGTDNTGTGAITVAVNTATEGAKTGGVTLAYQTAGAVGGVSNGLGTAAAGTQGVTVNGNVYKAATGAIQTAALNFGTVQVGQVVSQNLVVRNTATGANGFVEDLNASFGSSTGASAALIGGSGSLTGILAGTNSTSANGTLTVTVNTQSAGSVNGGIAVNYATAGTVNGVSNGLGTASAGSENYGVSGTIQAVATVINQASPLINTPTINLGSARVNDAAHTGFVSITNQATAAPQAALDASITSNGAPVTATGSVPLLAPGASSTDQLAVGLSTATAGNFTGGNAGSATIAFVSDASNVGGCTPHCQLDLVSQQVNVTGKVYTPAAAQVATVDFGIVHKGDTVSQGVTVTNSAPATALNDTLQGSIGGATGPFTASGTLTGVAAGFSNSSSFQAGLDTRNAGVFTGTATATFASHDADLADLSLGSQQADLKGQVNNYAEAAFAKTAGTATLTRVGNTYTLDFGSLVQGMNLTDSLSVLNSAVGPADLLRGSFDLSGTGAGFDLSGFTSFANLAAGVGQGGFSVTLDGGSVGTFDDVIVLHGFGSNASGYDAAIGDTTLILRGDVVMTAAVPEPGTYVLMIAGLLVVITASRSRRRGAVARAA